MRLMPPHVFCNVPLINFVFSFISFVISSGVPSFVYSFLSSTKAFEFFSIVVSSTGDWIIAVCAFNLYYSTMSESVDVHQPPAPLKPCPIPWEFRSCDEYVSFFLWFFII